MARRGDRIEYDRYMAKGPLDDPTSYVTYQLAQNHDLTGQSRSPNGRLPVSGCLITGIAILLLALLKLL